MASNNDDEIEGLEAEHVYVLMSHKYRISRNSRAQWYFSNLDKFIRVPKCQSVDEYTDDLDVVSVIPADPPADWDSDTSHLYRYRVSPNTHVTYLARVYRLVFCLDLSPSVATVDTVSGMSLLEAVFPSVKRCLEGVTRPFYVPGSELLYKPMLYITVIAHTPFFTSQAHQVLVQGWMLTQENLESFLSTIETKLEDIEDKFAEVSTLAKQQLEMQRLESERMTGKLFEDEPAEGSGCAPAVPMVSPDIGFVNMLRYGILALQLLPVKSGAGLVVVTDGAIALPDATLFDSLLVQLRNNTVACSFLQLGSGAQLDSPLGILPYTDLMQFLATATCGALLSHLPPVAHDYEYTMNVYHRAFLSWGFQKSSAAPDQTDLASHTRSWSTPRTVGDVPDPPQNLISKRQSVGTLNASLKSVLSCRLREGYNIRHVHIQDDSIRINLVLPWKHSIFIEYLLKSPWPPDGETVHFDLSILANYDFLHDVMCSKTTRTKSLYRRAMFNKFWINLKSLRHSDQLLVHLHSFNRSPPPYTVPEPVRRGNPLFYMSDDTGVLEPFSRESGLQALCNFWRPVCMLDINIWEKWMHAHRIGLLLEHDHPLPKHLFLPNNSGRHHSVQCRQATKAVTTMLAEISDFALMDGHSYIKFLYNEEGEPPVSFYMLRVNMVVRPPCMVVRLAFLGGTPGDLRYQIVNELRCRILSLTFTEGHTTLSLDPPIRKSAQLIERSSPSHPGGVSLDLPSTDKRPTVHYNSARPATQEVKCCILLQKPVEKFLIRYDRVPQNFLVAAIQRTYPAATFRRPLPCHNSAVSSQNKTASAMFNILSRYLHHRRWVWDMQDSSGFPVSMNAMGRILSAIVKSRLREGFSFAHSSSGIINLVLEMEMEGPAHGRSEPLQTHPCVLQYVVFPPHVATPSGSRDNLSQSDDELAESDLGSSEADGESQMITECWVEPQSGLLVDRQQMRFDRLTYDQAAAKFYEMDRECISTLLTLEYLSMMCDVQAGTRVPSPDGGLSQPQPSRPDGERGTQRVGFCFDLPGLLNHCQQVEIILSTYVQDLSGLVLPQPVVGETGAVGDTDAANCLLFQLLLETIQTLHQREVKLHPRDFRSIPTLIAARQRPANRPDPPFQADLDGRLPAWRCFVKCISRTHAVVTLLPASYADLKLLVSTRLDGGQAAAGGGAPGSSACQLVPADAEQCLRSLFGPDSRADSLANSSHGSASLRHRSGSVSAQLLAHTACPDSSQSPTATTSSGSAAASSPVSSEQLLMLQRDRARSVGSEAAAMALTAMVGGGSKKTVTLVETGAGAGVGCVPTGEERPARAPPSSGPQRRSRNPSSPSKLHAGDWERGAFPHRSCSFPNSEAAAAAARRRQAGTAAGAQAESSPTAGGRNSSCALLGSLNLPIYVYDCPLRSLTQLLAHADDAARGHDVFRDERFILSDRPLDGGPVTLGRYYSRSSDAEEPQYMSEHCDVLQMAHTRAFVVGIFRLMQRSQLIHPLDVQSAIDVCDEQPLEVDITNFLKMICGHVRDFDAFSCHQLLSDPAAAAEDVPPPAGRPFPLSVLLSHQPCEQLRIVHSEVKRRFDRILATNFGLAPGTNAVYYYLTPALRTSAEDGASLPDDDPEYVPSADEDITVVQFGDIEASAVWRGVQNQDAESRSLATRTSQTSLISNVGSDSGADLEDRAEQVVDEPEEDTMPPLFLQLTCSVRAGSECFTHHVRRLPTCIGELVLGLKARQIHLDTLQVTLDILCLTLPDQLHTRIQDHANHQVRATSFCSDGAGSSDVPDMCSDTTSITDENSFVTSQLGQLTEYQLQAVTATRTELQWLLVDEMASLMLTICPVKSSSLTSVVDHVRRSAGQIQCPFPRRSCVHKQVPLNFVFGASQSIPKFLEHFGRFSVPGYKLAQLEDLYYLVHENSVSEPLMHSSLVPPLPPPHNFSPTDTQQSALVLLRCRSFSNDDVMFRVKLARSISSDDFSHKPDIPAGGNTAGSSCAAAASSSSSTGDGGRRQRRSTSRRQTSGPRPATDTPMTLEDREVATLLTDAGRSPELQHLAPVTMSTEQSVPGMVRCRSAGEMYDGPRSRPSLLLSRLTAPTAMREDGGYDGDHSDADQDTRDEAAHALLPNFWLIISVSNGMVDAYFHCRYRQENLLDNMKILDDVIARINAMCKLVNQVLLLENLEATRMCNNLLEPESSEDIWSKVNQDSFSTDVCEPNYLEANMQFRPGHFACPLVWSTTFPLHPRLRGPSGTPSPGLAFLRQALETLAVANRRNMFVLKDTLHGEHVFYLRLRDTWEMSSGHPSGDSNSGGALGDERYSRYSLSAASQEMRASRTTISTDRHTSASSRADSDDGVQLCVHGISEPNESIHRDLVDSMRNRLDDRLLEMIAMALLRNPQTKLTPDDVHFIQTPGEMPQRLLKYTLPPSATLHMSSVLFHLRKNLLQLLHLPKYTDNRIENQLRNFGGCDGSEMYLYVPSEKRGSRGMAVVSVTPICTCPSPPSQGPFFPPVSVVPPPSRDPPLTSPSLLLSPFSSALSDSDDTADVDTRDPIPLVFSFDTPPQQLQPLSAAAAAGVDDCHQQLPGHWRPEMFEQLTHTELLPDSTDEEYPAVWLMFNIWEKCRVNVDWLEERLPLAVRYALWDLCMEQYVLPWRPVISSSRDLSSSFRSFKTLDDVPMSALSRILERRISSPVVQDAGVSATCTTVAPDTPLQPVYGTVLQRWLEFGSRLAVPSLKHCTVNLNNRHMMGVFLTELVRLVGEEDPSLLCSLFRPRQRCPGGAGDGHDETSFDSCDMDELTDATCDGYLLVGYGRREDGGWTPHRSSLGGQLSTLGLGDQDSISSLSVPHSPALTPGGAAPLKTPSESMASPLVGGHAKHKLVWARVADKQVLMFTYNWPRDKWDYLCQRCLDLCQWSNARSALLHSILMQKLGLFHNQPFTRKQRPLSDKNVKMYVNQPAYVSHLIKCMAPPSQLPSIGGSVGGRQVAGRARWLTETLRDCRPAQLQQPAQSCDAALRHGQQLIDVYRANRKADEQKKLYQQCQSPELLEKDVSVQSFVQLVRGAGRLLHFCFTPLLFLPSWRWQTAVRRDQAVSMETVVAMETAAAAAAAARTAGRREPFHRRLRHVSESERSVGRPSPRLRRLAADERWHETLCGSLVREFLQYLQTIGFLPLQCGPQSATTQPPATERRAAAGDAPPRRSTMSAGAVSTDPQQAPRPAARQRWPPLTGDAAYLHRAILPGGGYLLFEVGVDEPYFYVKLYALEGLRPEFRSRSSPVNLQTFQTFLSECDEIRAHVHLHSYMHDHHLRTMHQYIHGRPLVLRQGLHITSFLEDFYHYYPKGPSHARNFMTCGSMVVEDLGAITTDQLYNYLLAHEKRYQLRVLRMIPLFEDLGDEMSEDEYVLVRVTSVDSRSGGAEESRVYDLTLVVSRDTADRNSTGSRLSLRFYLLLTSRREMYPTMFVERKFENYRRVDTAPSVLPEVHSPVDSPASVVVAETLRAVSVGCTTAETAEKQETLVELTRSGSGHINTYTIRPEPVHYLGYFSSHENFMQTVLCKEVDSIRNQIINIVERAKVHCRRDSLWQRLKDEDKNTSGLCCAELAELLSLLHCKPLELLDRRLSRLEMKSSGWYAGLFKTLSSRYWDCHRCYQSDLTSGMKYLVVILPVETNSLIVLGVGGDLPTASLALVTRELTSDVSDSAHSCDATEAADDSQLLHQLTEEFINCCCFYLWSSLLHG